MKKETLVIGSEGLVGSRFLEISDKTDSIYAPKQSELDLLDIVSLSKVFQSHDFDSVINFAAFTDVGKAESERENREGIVWKVNVEGVENLVSFIDPKKTHFIQISTDMVFPGSQIYPGPYDEDSLWPTDSKDLTWYGYTKGEAERVTLNLLGGTATILRIIYPVRSKFNLKSDFLTKPLLLFDQGKLYPMFSDQQITISFVDEICIALDKIIKGRKYGIYHAGSEDVTTPFEIVNYMLEKLRGVKNAVIAQTVDEFLEKTNEPAIRYPKFGGLKVEKTERLLGIKYSKWKEIVDKLIEQGLGK